MRLVSLDVFDTALERTVLHPHDVHRLVGERLHDILGLDPETWCTERVAAEVEAREAAAARGLGEVTFAEVLEVLARRLGLDEESRELAGDEELAIERAVLRRTPTGWRLAEVALTHGLPLAFTSDMYLPATVLSEVLHREGYRWEHLVVSSEERTTKVDGGLYEVLSQRSGTPLAGVLHLGDNVESDKLAADRVGCRGVLVEAAHRAAAPLVENRSVARSGSDALVLHRAATRLGGGGVAVDVDVGYSLGGPVLAGFAAWIAGVIDQVGPDRVLFCARDGRLVLDAVRLLRPDLDEGRFRYLLGSRRSLGVPALAGGFDRDGMAFALSGTTPLPLASYALRLGLTADEVVAELGSGGSWDLDRVVAPDEVTAIHGFLRAIEPLVRARASRELEALGSHLAGLGVGDGQRLLLVDLGWHGSLQRHLERALDLLGLRSPLEGAYLGLLSDPGRSARAWAFAPGQRQAQAERARIRLELLEALFQAPHPTVDHYGVEGPVFGPSEGNEALLDRLHAGSMELVAWVAEEVDQRWLTPALLEPVLRAMERPTVAEARALGRFRHAEGFGAGAPSEPLVRLPRRRDLLRDPRAVDRGSMRSHWPHGYEVLAVDDPVLRAARRAHHAVGRARRAVRDKLR